MKPIQPIRAINASGNNIVDVRRFVVPDSAITQGSETVTISGGSVAIGDTITGATQGSVLFAGAAGVLAQANSNFFFNAATNQLRLTAGAATDTPLKIQLAATPSADALDVFASDGTTKLASIDNFGTITSANNILAGGTAGTTGGILYFVTSLTNYSTGSKITNPADGRMSFISNGGNTFSLVGGGASVASATALPLPTGNVFHVTGTTAITSITSTNFQSGVTITLIFDGILTFTNGNNIKLNAGANFTTAAGSTITMAYDGTNWYEVGRKAT